MRTMSKSDETKKRILGTALELFNQSGPDNVSTVQILNALQISPGNLYYYYRNKEEIIRELFAAFVLEYGQNWDTEKMKTPEFDVIRGIVNNLRIYFKYRFLLNHISALAHNDPQLGEEYNRVTAQRQSELCAYFQMLEDNGIMDFKHDPERIHSLVSVLWFLGDFWLMNKELKSGKVNAITPQMEEEYLQINLFLTNQFLTPGIEMAEHHNRPGN